MNVEEAEKIAAAVFKAKKQPPVSAKWEQVVNSMAVHVEGRYPQELIEMKRPNEPASTQQYRKDNYSPITVSVMEEAMSGLYRIFNPDNFEVKVSKDLGEYVDGNNFAGTDFLSWAQYDMLPRMVIDPNAWVVVLPAGEVLEQTTGRLDPKIEIIESSKIWAHGADYLMWLSDEVVVYQDANNRNQTGRVFFMLTDEAFRRYEQVSSKDTDKYNVVFEFEHRTGSLPALPLGGIPHTTDGPAYFESWFRGAVPFGNECLKQYSDYNAILTMCGFPVREVRAVECNAQGCQDGYTYAEDKTKRACQRCGGSGRVPELSPFGEYVQPIRGISDDGPAQPPVIFHSNPTAPLEYAERSWSNMYTRMRQALHLEYVNESQSGVAKMIDREPAYAQLLRISNHVWETLIFSLLEKMERMRNWQAPVEVVVVKPTEFSLRTESDLVNELSQLRSSGAPNDLIIEVLRELIRKRYAGNDVLIAKHDFLIQTDPLYDSSDQTKAFYFNTGMVTAEVLRYNLWAGSVLDRIIAQTKANPIMLFERPDALYESILIEISRRSPEPVRIPTLG